jgi:DNA-binding Lrp family transcriptional regulator
MEKLDLKDRKILYNLNLDSRQSFAKIGKKVGLHKDAVARRVQKLQENGIIENFRTEIDECKLGYSYIRLYFNFQFADPNLKREMIDSFKNYSYCRGVHLVQGHYDLLVGMAVKSIPEFYNKWGEKVLTKYKNFINNQIFSVMCLVSSYKPIYLLPEYKDDIKRGKKYTFYGTGARVNLDDFDLKLLDLIAKKMNSTSIRIKNHINNLKKIGVIHGFTIGLNYRKIGLNLYKADLFLKDHTKLDKIIRYIEKNPSLDMTLKSIGYADVEFAFVLKDSIELRKIMDELSEKFPDIIKNYVFYKIIESHSFQSWEPSKK